MFVMDIRTNYQEGLLLFKSLRSDSKIKLKIEDVIPRFSLSNCVRSI